MDFFDLDEDFNDLYLDETQKNELSSDKKQKFINAILKSENLLKQMEYLIKLSRGCRLANSFLEEMKDPIQRVADKLDLTPLQTLLLLPFIMHPDEDISTSQLTNYFFCTAPKIISMENDLNTLVHRRYLSRRSSYHGSSLILSLIARKAFANNEGLMNNHQTNQTPLEFLTAFGGLLRDCFTDRLIGLEDLKEETLSLVKQNSHLEIVKALNDYQLTDDELFVTLYFCKRLVFDCQRDINLDTISQLFEDFYFIERAFQFGSHPLIKKNILEPFGKEMLIKDVFQLTDQARQKLLSEYDIIEVNNEEDSSKYDILSAKDIKPKSMFYSATNQKEINILTDLLSPGHFDEIRKSLLDNNMRPGFNCLFYGAPGTGKTETAHQIARVTGRDIMQVDISSIRDMWYGNTEKFAREIFDNYAEMVKKRPVAPILLFNEADALLSVRTQLNNSHSLDKTENAIQNILLEGMEQLDGIMIATTNLTENMDNAFDRRFIYKVCFEQPSIEAKTAIWKSFLPELSDEDAHDLASHYDFSGGQIENIARKSFVEKILFSTTASRQRLIELCNMEKLINKNTHTAMGFRH